MELFRFAFAFFGVCLTLLGALTDYETDAYAAAIFAILVGLSFTSLNRTAQVFAVPCALLTGYSIAVERVAVDFSASAFLFAFLTVSGSLRVAAANERSILALGERLSKTATNRQFILVSLSTAVFALVLLNGALNFVSGIFASKAGAPLADRLRITRTFISGFALNPILSPMAIPFVVVSSTLPAISWPSILPYLLICGGLVWLSGRVQNAALPNAVEEDPINEIKPKTLEPQTAAGSQVTAIALIITPIVTTIALVVFASLKPSIAAFVSVFLASLLWPGLRLKRPKLILSGYTIAINEATIISSSLLLGTLFLIYFPTEWERATAALLLAAGPFAAALIIVFFVGAGLLGLQPSISFLISYTAVFPYVAAYGEATAPVYAALIVGWALNSLVSPVGLPVMVVSQAFNIPSFDFALKHGKVFLCLSTVLTSLVLTFVMM